MTKKIVDPTVVADETSLILRENLDHLSCLVMIYGEYMGRRFPIQNGSLLIGRTPDCDIQLTDDCLSRSHCKVAVQEDSFILEDCKSTNGTFVNGEPISTWLLTDGDRIKVGRSIFKFLSGDNIEAAYHEEIYRLKTTDSLTGAYNKRYFLEECQREIYRFTRHQRPVSVVMLDIDHFKKINDNFGHIAGDQVLAHLGNIIGSVIRFEDTFCRFGGEEFIILMPERRLAEGIEVAERVRKLVHETVFEFEERLIPVTISLGVAELEQGMGEPNDLIQVADERLYSAKNSGRNRVEPPPQEE